MAAGARKVAVAGTFPVLAVVTFPMLIVREAAAGTGRRSSSGYRGKAVVVDIFPIVEQRKVVDAHVSPASHRKKGQQWLSPLVPCHPPTGSPLT